MARSLSVIFVAAVLTACGGEAPVPAGSCVAQAEQVPARVAVRAQPVAAVIRRDLDLSALARLRRRDEAGKLQGLTLVEHRLGYKTSVAFRRRFWRRGGCAWLESLSVDLTPASVTIYVPREYPEDSCEARAVLEHERLHEAIHQRGLAALAERLRRVLSEPAVPGLELPLPAGDRAEAERRLVAAVEAVVEPVYDGFQSALESDQAAIDDPQSYRSVTASCQGWK